MEQKRWTDDDLNAAFRNSSRLESFDELKSFLLTRRKLADSLKGEDTVIPEGHKIYTCTNSGEKNIKLNNGKMRVGFCDKCEHPLWN